MVGQQRTVLVAEDEEKVRELVTLILEREGYRVIAVEHGRRAVTILESIERVDLVFTDLQMPHMGGAELGRQVARICPGTPVLYTSGSGPGVDDIEPAGAFLRKPYKPQELASAIAKILYGLQVCDRRPRTEAEVIEFKPLRQRRSRP